MLLVFIPIVNYEKSAVEKLARIFMQVIFEPHTEKRYSRKS